MIECPAPVTEQGAIGVGLSQMNMVIIYRI
jgi:hypothetical protein